MNRGAEQSLLGNAGAATRRAKRHPLMADW